MRNKIAIVTGGGSGLGDAIAKALAGRGVKVVLSDINLKGAHAWPALPYACGRARRTEVVQTDWQPRLSS